VLRGVLWAGHPVERCPDELSELVGGSRTNRPWRADGLAPDLGDSTLVVFQLEPEVVDEVLDRRFDRVVRATLQEDPTLPRPRIHLQATSGIIGRF
jgi:hypothetical protein